MSALRASLSPHPTAPDVGIGQMAVEVTLTPTVYVIAYHLSGDLSAIVWPKGAGGQRRDELWKHTCFEAFFRSPNGTRYAEYNLAPNGDWAAYEFDDYRAHGRELTCAPPSIETKIQADAATMQLTIPHLNPDAWPGPLLFGPAAVIETQSGVRSYWALHHPLNKPDFHHVENFKIRLD